MDKLYEMSLEAYENAYAPYSNFKVGAALETKSGRIFTGCNVENVSYGLSVCAERIAIFKAVSEGETEFKRLLVVANTDAFYPSCGACRQVEAEFGLELELIVANLKGDKESFILSELLPHAFVPEALTENK
jgi:cytidine deaminase